jgi:hypothetical protein
MALMGSSARPLRSGCCSKSELLMSHLCVCMRMYAYICMSDFFLLIGSSASALRSGRCSHTEPLMSHLCVCLCMYVCMYLYASSVRMVHLFVFT